MKPKKTHEQRLLERIRVLEQQLDAVPLGLRALPAEYLVELGTLASIALYGVKRPDDRGYTVAMHAESRPPGYNADAHQALSREVNELRARAVNLAGTVRSFDPGIESGVDRETTAAGPGESFQTRRVAG